jgi:methionine synthase II (cobalamin-independent)
MGDRRRILTTHVGSLIRPPELVAYYQAIEKALDGGPRVGEAAFDNCVRESVAAAVAHQARLGIDIVSDGEFGKSWLWANYTIDRMSGLEQRELSPGEKPFSPIHGVLAPFRGQYPFTARTGAISRSSTPSTIRLASSSVASADARGVGP